MDLAVALEETNTLATFSGKEDGSFLELASTAVVDEIRAVGALPQSTGKPADLAVATNRGLEVFRNVDKGRLEVAQQMTSTRGVDHLAQGVDVTGDGRVEIVTARSTGTVTESTRYCRSAATTPPTRTMT